MADKFGITAELLLVLDSNIESTIDELRTRINKKNTSLRLDLQQKDIKDILKEFKGLQTSLENKPFKVSIQHKPEDIKLIYREIGFLKKSLYNHPLKIRFDSSSVELAVKNILANVNSVKNSLKSKPIDANVGVNSTVLEAEIKKVYKEIGALRTSLNTPLKFSIQAVNDQEIVRISNLIKTLKSKNLSIGLNLKKNTLDNFQKLSTAVGSLNSQVSGFNINQFDAIAQKTQAIARSITALNKINGKKITFDLALKDIKNVDKLESGLNRVNAAFIKATASGAKFNNVIKSMGGIISNLQSGLSGLNFSSINAAAKSIKTLSGKSSVSAQNALTSSIKNSTSALYDLGVQSGITLKRFGAYTLVTAGFFRLSFAIRNAVSEFIDFDKQLTRIRQVTGQSLENTAALGDEVSRLATQYGVSSTSILNTAQVLAQAGYSTNQVKEAMEALALTELAPTFDNIENTVEGAIAAMTQFGFSTDKLQEKMGSINAVAAAFAVESSDITTAIQKAGGAFASAGGSLDELTSLFTTVRSSTRESADTVAVGIRTITTRLQRLSTSKFLEEFGISIRRTSQEVKDFQEQFGQTPDFKAGDFVGTFEALKRISEATSNIGGADPRLAQIAEELAGFRQINKIIPLLRNFETSQNAMQIAIGGTNSLARDAIVAQESYANQLEKVRQEFQLMIREFGDNKAIRDLIKDILDLTRFTIKLAASFKDLLLPLSILGTFKIASNTGPFIKGIKDSFLAKKDGGYIPGVGNKDTIPALLTPGEFVIKKPSARKLGRNRLNMLNDGILPKFASGGFVGKNKFNLAATGAGIAGLGLSLGGFESLRKLDDTTKETGIAFASLISQILVGVGVFKSFGGELKFLREKIRNFNLKPTDPKLAQSFEKRRELRDVAASGSDFLKTSRNNQNIQIAGNKIVGNQKSDRTTNSSLVRLVQERTKLEKGLSSFGVDANSQANLTRNIKTLDQKILKKKQEYVQALNQSITQEKVDPRSSAGKRGLTSQFRIKDSQTGVFRNFDTRKQALDFGIQRNNLNKRREIGSLITTRDSRSNRLRDLQNTQQRLSSVNSSIQARESLIKGPNLKEARLLGTLEGRKEKVNQANITTRIQERLTKQEIDKAGARRGTTGIRSVFGTATSGFGKFSGSTAGAGTGLALALGGQLLGSSIQRANSADKGVGASTNNAIGGAISSGTTGAALGATIGTLIAPGIGTAVGIAIGGIGGAAYGAINSLKEFDGQLAAISSQGSIDSISKIFEEIKAGNTTSKTSTFGVTSNIKNLNNQLQSTGDPSARENIFAELNNQKVNIANFVTDIAKISSSYDNFSQRIDKGTQRFIAGIVGVPFSDFEKNIKEQIETSNKLDESFKRGIESIQKFDNTVSSIIRFSEAFSLASQRVNSFTNNLEAFASGSAGSTSIKNNLSSNLTNLQSGISTRGLEKQVIDFTKQFGESGQSLGKTASDIIKASNILPDILLNLRSGSALDDAGAISEKFANSLEKSGIGKEVSNLLISRVEDLLGASSQDTEFFKNLNKDPQKAIQTLLEGTKPALDAISQAYETSTVRLNEFSASLEKVRGFDKAILDGVIKSQDRSQLIQARGVFSGKDVNPQLLNNQRNITRLNTGGLSVGQLQANVNQRQSNIQGLTNQLENTEDIQIRSRIQVALEKERSALDKTTTALSYLANTTSELSVLQQQLNKAQSERLSKRDFALDFATGTPEERDKLSRTARAARSAAATGSLSGTPLDLKKDVVSFLKTFSDSIIDFGKTGQDVLNNIANNTTGLPIGFQNTGTPTKEESKIQTQIEASLKTQQEAQKAINSILIADRNAFSTQLNKDMQTFFTDLSIILSEGENRSTRNQIGETSNRLGEVVRKRDSFTNIQSRFGGNALINAQQIKGVNEDLKNFGNSSDITKIQSSAKLIQEGIKINNSSINPFSDTRIGSEDFFNRVNKLIDPLGVDQKNNVLQLINEADLGADKNNTISLSKSFGILDSALSKILQEANSKTSVANSDREKLIQNVGGVKNFDAISKDVASKDSVLLKSINDFPKDTSLNNLNSEINNLRGQLEALNSTLSNRTGQPIRRNSGGIIPGVGNTDSVPALLTPGEFVIKKDTVNKLGLNNLIKLNAQKFANGGLVRNRRLQDYKENFPKTIASNLDNYGVSILSSDKITNIDPELRFQKPRGSNSSFDDIKGLYRNQSKQILIREDSGIDVLFHELGHAFDYSEGTISDSKKYIIAYKRDVSKLNEEQKKKFAYYLQNGIGGQRESFAAIFDSVIRNNSTSSSVFPEATKVVQENVKASEIRNLHDSYKEIIKLRSSETPDFNLLLDKIKESKLKISSSALVKDDSRVQKFLNQLNVAEELYSQKVVRRNSGGIVPGFGSTDSVPALLTPGEFVLNKNAVKNVGLQTLRKTNSGAKKFASGGMVENNTIIDKESVSRFNIAVNQLGIQIQNMRDAISKIPTEITMNGTHRVDVFINGAQAFNQMKPEFADLVRAEIKNSINKLIKTKMPNLGNFEG